MWKIYEIQEKLQNSNLRLNVRNLDCFMSVLELKISWKVRYRNSHVNYQRSPPDTVDYSVKFSSILHSNNPIRFAWTKPNNNVIYPNNHTYTHTHKSQSDNFHWHWKFINAHHKTSKKQQRQQTNIVKTETSGTQSNNIPWKFQLSSSRLNQFSAPYTGE